MFETGRRRERIAPVQTSHGVNGRRSCAVLGVEHVRERALVSYRWPTPLQDAAVTATLATE